MNKKNAPKKKKKKKFFKNEKRLQKISQKTKICRTNCREWKNAEILKKKIDNHDKKTKTFNCVNRNEEFNKNKIKRTCDMSKNWRFFESNWWFEQHLQFKSRVRSKIVSFEYVEC